MKKYILILVLILLLTFTSIGYSAWLGGWDYRIELQIADYAGDIGASVTWFPVTVFLTSTQGEEVFVELTTDAEYLKVAFTKADGTTELYAEKELFDVSGQKGIFHVSRTGWTINANTSVYMYYDKDHSDNTDFIGVVGSAGRDGPRENVWNPEYKMVHHMQGAAYTDLDDSTSNDNDVTVEGGNPLYNQTGKIGNAIDLDGTDDYISVPDGINLGNNAFTLELVFNATAFGGVLFTKRDGDSTNIEWVIYSNSAPVFSTFTSVGGSASDPVTWGSTLNTGTWYHLTAIHDPSNTQVHLQIDGQARVTEAKTQTITDSVSPFRIGARHTTPEQFFNGLVEEVRVTLGVRSTAWMKGTKNTLWDDLFTYGSEETAPIVEVDNAIFFGMNF